MTIRLPNKNDQQKHFLKPLRWISCWTPWSAWGTWSRRPIAPPGNATNFQWPRSASRRRGARTSRWHVLPRTSPCARAPSRRSPWPASPGCPRTPACRGAWRRVTRSPCTRSPESTCRGACSWRAVCRRRAPRASVGECWPGTWRSDLRVACLSW